MSDPSKTDFSTWKFASLAQLAQDQQMRIRQLEAALEDRRQDVRFMLEKLRQTMRGEPTPPAGYTADELDRDNPHNQWMYDK